MSGLLYAPWHLVAGKSNFSIYGTQPGVTLRIRIATVNTAITGQLEKASVMAAAPDLLEALRMVRDADEDCIRDHLTRMPSTARRLIDDAIAKATGSAAPPAPVAILTPAMQADAAAFARATCLDDESLEQSGVL